MRKPPTVIPECELNPNHLRFRISPEITIALGTTVLAPGEVLEAENVEMMASRTPRPGEMEAYERLLGDAMAGDATQFARRRLCGRSLANRRSGAEGDDSRFTSTSREHGDPARSVQVTPPGGWQNPTATEQTTFA